MMTVEDLDGRSAMAEDASYREFSGTAADNYERYFVPAIGEPVSRGLLAAAGLRSGERVLDVGCGTGIVARQAATAVGATGSVTGVDIAADMLAVAAAHTAPGGAPIEWREGDACDLPFADSTFDVVLCQMSLMFVEDRNVAVREMHRVLRGGGRAVVVTPGPIQPTFELMEQAIVRHISPALAGFVRLVFSIHDPDELRDVLRSAGFADIETSGYCATLDLPSPRDFLWQYINLTPMAPFVAEALAPAKEALEQQVVETWEPYVHDGRTPVEQPMVLAAGVKR